MSIVAVSLTAPQKVLLILSLLALTALAVLAGFLGLAKFFVTIDMTEPTPVFQALCYSLVAVALIGPLIAWLTMSWRHWKFRLAMAALPITYTFVLLMLTLSGLVPVT